MTKPNSVDAASLHPIVLMPCPFCGSNEIDPPNEHSRVFRLKHKDDCFIGVKDWNRESWFTPGSEDFERWNSQVDREDAEAYRRLKRGLAESHKASLGKDCGVWDSRNVGQ